MAKAIPNIHLINTLINADLPKKILSALNEFIDNSLGSAAGNCATVEIHYHKDFIMIADDGDGVKDINYLFTLGDSHSRLSDSDIGSFGYGAKVGALYLGYKVEVQTVRDGLYHKHTVDWALAEKRGDWPELYDGKGLSPKKAPKFIQSGGTMITIKKRHDFRQWKLDSMADKIAHTYTPALVEGKNIFLVSHLKSGKRKVRKLKSSSASRNLRNIVEFRGEVNGKKFLCKAGEKSNNTKDMNALHIGYGHRFIKSEHSLNGYPLPFGFYGEVILDRGWKNSLSATKNEITRDKAALLDEVKKGCESLLDDISKMSNYVRMDIINTQIAGVMTDILDGVDVGSDGDGEAGEIVPGTVVRKKTEVDRPHKPTPPQEEDAEVIVKNKEGENKVVPIKKRRGTGIILDYKPLGDALVYTAAMAGDTLVIILNEDIPYINSAASVPYNTSAIWGIMSTALVTHIFDDLKDRAKMVPSLEKVVRDTGDAGMEERDKLLRSLLMCAPAVKEPTANDIKLASGEV